MYENLLVTGGMGFIGSHFVEMMLTRNDISILNFDNLSTGSNPKNLEAATRGKRNYIFVKGDICDKDAFDALRRKNTKIDAVVNFAAETHVDRSIGAPRGFFRTNVMGTVSLLEFCRQRDIGTFLQVSSDEVYGAVNGKRLAKEDDALLPSNPYAASKASADLLVQSYHKTYGIACKITRCTNNFGPFQSHEKLIPKTILLARLGLKIPVYGEGLQRREWIFVKDHCLAVDLVLHKGRSGEIYNVGSGLRITNLSLVKRILRLMGKPKLQILHTRNRPAHDARYALNTEKIRRLGWKPIFSFQDSLVKTVGWYQRNHAWFGPQERDRALFKSVSWLS